MEPGTDVCCILEEEHVFRYFSGNLNYSSRFYGELIKTMFLNSIVAVWPDHAHEIFRSLKEELLENSFQREIAELYLTRKLLLPLLFDVMFSM